jgi:hypothetical protein
VADLLGALGFTAFTIRHTNFLPLLTHVIERVPDFAKDPTLGQTDPGLTATTEYEKAVGAEMTPAAKMKRLVRSADFFREVFM